MWQADEPVDLEGVLTELEAQRSADVPRRLGAAAELEAVAIAAGDTASAMRARLVRADMLHRVGDIAGGTRLAGEVQTWATEHGRTALAARCHLVLSSIFEGIGDPPSSLDHAVRGIDLLSDDTPPFARGNHLLRLADALAYCQSADQARRRYEEAREVFARAGNHEHVQIVLNNATVLESELGDPAAAAALAGRLEAEAAGEMNSDYAETIARARLVAGELALAERAARLGQELLAAQGDTKAHSSAELSLTLAEILLAQGRTDEAQAELDHCLDVCRQRDLAGMEAAATEVLARLHAARGDFELAYTTHRQFHAASTRLRSEQHEAAARTREALFRMTEAREEAERYRRQARVDPLTELRNRRFVDETLPSWVADAAGRSLVVAIVDLDNFKRVNDEHSHATGDEVIRAVGQLLATALESEDAFVARIGGEEFLAVDRSGDVAGALDRIERLRIHLADHAWPGVGTELRMTLSAGVAIAGDDDTASTLFARADRHLHRAKRGGRNMVVADAY